MSDQPRGIFHEESEAQSVIDQLVAKGFTAILSREAFAGEDDDEDRAWAVTTDAPQVLFELLIDEHDGWYDVPAPPTSAPLVLPTGPQRIKNPRPLS